MTASLSARISTPPATGTRLPSASETNELTKAGSDAARAARLRLPTPMFNAPWAFPRAKRSGSVQHRNRHRGKVAAPCVRKSTHHNGAGGSEADRGAPRVRHRASKRESTFLFDFDGTLWIAIAQPIVFV